ncbi:MAG: 3-keto-5-aminohexanoate cleavage protein, partial [Burkholderiales bacterium]|nr:3-keto-5-aminohexanoate cleavage protein [Burkholderiales bacterium]
MTSTATPPLPERAPIAVASAPNGARKTHADHPALPITPDELAATARACLDAGAAMLH